jgi:hypothetical protein
MRLPEPRCWQQMDLQGLFPIRTGPGVVFFDVGAAPVKIRLDKIGLEPDRLGIALGFFMYRRIGPGKSPGRSSRAHPL